MTSTAETAESALPQNAEPQSADPPSADPPSDERQAAREALAERVFEACVTGIELLAVDLGLRLGLYEAMGDRACTPADLAAAAGIHDRYAREWLEQQAAAGILVVAAEAEDDYERAYRLPAGHADTLIDGRHPDYIGSLAPSLTGLARVVPDLVDAYRTGGGIGYADYGRDIRHGIGHLNRPMFEHDLAASWLPAIDDVARRIHADEEPRILDLGCGIGYSTIALARAFPHAHVVGVDLDDASIHDARDHAVREGVADRVAFVVGDAAEHGDRSGDGLHLVTMFESLHDMADPVGALSQARAMLVPGGCVLIGDEGAAEEFAAPADLTERFFYGWSVLHCLPATRAEGTEVEAGTVFRPGILRELAHDAGFDRVEVLDVENPFWRFYALYP